MFCHQSVRGAEDAAEVSHVLAEYQDFGGRAQWLVDAQLSNSVMGAEGRISAMGVIMPQKCVEFPHIRI